MTLWDKPLAKLEAAAAELTAVDAEVDKAIDEMDATEACNAIIVPCDACQTEGRIYVAAGYERQTGARRWNAMTAPARTATAPAARSSRASQSRKKIFSW